MNAAYLNYKRFQFTDNRTYASNSNGDIKDMTTQVFQDLPQIINNFSGMVDYIQKFKNDLTISVGGNYNRTKTDNDSKNITYFYDPAKTLIQNRITLFMTKISMDCM